MVTVTVMGNDPKHRGEGHIHNGGSNGKENGRLNANWGYMALTLNSTLHTPNKYDASYDYCKASREQTSQ